MLSRKRFVFVLLQAVLLACMVGKSRASDAEAVTSLVRQYVAAQQRFDAASMDQLMAPDYMEVSPVGDLDQRAAVLGFYAPSQRHVVPATSVEDTVVHVYHGTANAVVRLVYSTPTLDGGQKRMVMRAGYTAVKQAGHWRLVFAQYTSQRSSQP